eukprot:TRINITY_DN12776_c0_g1_i1.p1 TRINITY_DN12776_c0_g1~~TRINITY_DN12776_c0_g1_i1.p1  ORF type:complete len:122 (+),score=14.85 TRINITY_DN12776_c0_g1_i1:63-428(+)
MITTFLIFHLVNFLLSNITGFSVFIRHSIDQLSASPLSSPPCLSPSIYSMTNPQVSTMLLTLFGQSPHHLHPTGPQPDKHPTPLPHVIQGHGMSVLAHHLHEVVTVDMGDLLHHLEHLETT